MGTRTGISCIAFLLFFLVTASDALPFRIWGRAGDAPSGDSHVSVRFGAAVGSMPQAKLFVPDSGLRFLGFYGTTGNEEEALLFGINEAGLAVVIISPCEDTAHTAERIAIGMLMNFASVDTLIMEADRSRDLPGGGLVLVDFQRIISLSPVEGRLPEVTGAGRDWLICDTGSATAERRGTFDHSRCGRESTLPPEADGRGAPQQGVTLSILIPVEGAPEVSLTVVRGEDGEGFAEANLFLDRPFWTDGLSR